ncbi:MAG: hypothetical protein PHD81_03455 [Candidatus Nanoarchaeia archaeon]|nr:hypothetical protein [Candidatus Nanoarchaeia archaeon]MDD5588141.1 hypothetical protein [Candidatus Nanoarchaeia archaeon]
MGRFRSDRAGFREKSERSRSGRRSEGRSEGRGEGRGFRDRDSRSFERGPREMFDVICDKCGKECQVPFKPSSNKPIFCDECFRQKDGSRSRGSSGISPEQFNELNAKLDRIIEILETDVEEE